MTETDEFVTTAIPSEIPDLDRPVLVTRDEFSLIRMQCQIVHGR